MSIWMMPMVMMGKKNGSGLADLFLSLFVCHVTIPLHRSGVLIESQVGVLDSLDNALLFENSSLLVYTIEAASFVVGLFWTCSLWSLDLSCIGVNVVILAL